MYNVKFSKKSIKQLVSGEYSSNNADSREQLIDWWRSMTTTYHLTLTFPYLETEARCTEHLNEFFRKLNLRIFRARYSRAKSDYLAGVVVMEDTPAKDTVHFHVLIEGQQYLPEFERMKKLIEGVVASMNRGKRKKVDKFQLDQYRLAEGKSLERYLTKVFENSRTDVEALDRFACLSIGGIQFGEIGNSSRYGKTGFHMKKKVTASY